MLYPTELRAQPIVRNNGHVNRDRQGIDNLILRLGEEPDGTPYLLGLVLIAGRPHKWPMANSTGAADQFDLNRFVKAQEEDYPVALSEIKRGQKRSHWMWFIFPQIEGLGSSSTARFYSIKSSQEAKAYLQHSLLGQRLIECSEILLRLKDKSASEVFGYPDDLKLRSSMTLFATVSQPDSVFHRVLAQYYDGKMDEKTLELLKQHSPT